MLCCIFSSVIVVVSAGRPRLFRLSEEEQLVAEAGPGWGGGAGAAAS